MVNNEESNGKTRKTKYKSKVGDNIGDKQNKNK
jgi:hypothetical protein